MSLLKPPLQHGLAVGKVRVAAWALFLVVAMLALACYWPALQGGVVWDDAAHLTRPDLRSWAGLWRIVSELGATQQYYPVLHGAFWLEHRIWGDAVVGYHLANLVQHTLACGLFALLLRRTWGTGVAAGAEWLAAALLAVHPVCVESVAWISEQKNTLSLVFYLAAAHAYFSFDETRRVRFYVLALGWFVLALGTKSVTGSLPAALLIVFWWKRGAIAGRRDVLPLVPWFAMAVAMGLLTAWVERWLVGAVRDAEVLSLAQRALLAGRVLWFYLGKLAWPADLVFIYPRWDVPAMAVGWIGWLLGAGAVTIGLWLLRRRTRGPFAVWSFYLVALFPALGFFDVYPFRYSYVADHFQYLPALGILAGAAAVLAGVVAPLAGWRRGVALAAVVALPVGLAWPAHAQSRQYRNSETLYRATIGRNPECWFAHNNLGLELVDAPGRLPEAIAHCREAIRLKPDLPEAHLNLGLALARSGRPAEATESYERALRLRPGYPEALDDLGLVLEGLGRIPEAIAREEEAVRAKPDFFDARYHLANLLKKAGRPGEAAVQFEAALRIDPGVAEVWNDFGVALADHGSPGEAVAAFETALRLRPDFAAAHAELAGLLASRPDRLAEAIGHYERALRLAPGWPVTHYRLAVLLDGLPGREAEAERHYEEALRLNPNYAEAHNDLGVLLARRGEFARAREHWQAAATLKAEYEDPRRNLQLLEARLQR